MRRRQIPSTPDLDTLETVLCRRAWRHRRKGEERRAMLALREAAYRNREDARLWVFYGLQCARVGRWDDAEEALKHAAWVRERRHEPRKAAVTRALLGRLSRAA